MTLSDTMTFDISLNRFILGLFDHKVNAVNEHHNWSQQNRCREEEKNLNGFWQNIQTRMLTDNQVKDDEKLAQSAGDDPYRS